jgi:hypothetical protein
VKGPQRNIFYYYRGPSSNASNAADEERYQKQIEDNSTKALMNVLDLGGAGLTRSFLAHFAPPLAHGWAPGDEPRLFLQGGPERSFSGTRILLGISLRGQVEGPFAADDTGSRIDAAILIPSVGMLALEVKVVDMLEGLQLARHAKRWGILEDPLLTRWTDVWRWAHHERNRASSVQRFLLEQLCEYLEILGFAPWGGFRSEDLDYFAHPTLEQRAIVKSRLSGAWERILEGLSAEDRDSLGTIHSGRFALDDGIAWAQTNHGESGVNLTLELYGHELQLNLVGWNKLPAGRLLAWLSSGPEIAATRNLRGFQIVVFRREATTSGSGAPYWQRENHVELERLAASRIADGTLRGRLEELQTRLNPKWQLLAVHIRHTYSRAEVLGEGEDLAPVIIADVRRLLPLMRAVNGRG